MYKTSMMTIAAVLLLAPPLALAAEKCPTEVSQAKAMLNKAGAAATKAPRELAGARSQDVQAPRTPSQDVQAPRTPSQDVQAPRTPSQDVQAPRTPSQDVQAPRTPSQDVQAPRTPSQDVQAPRTPSQDVQAPRTPSQDVQAPRTPSQDVQAPRTASSGPGEQSSRVSNAQQLVKDAEAACKTGDMTTASAKAREAMALLK